MKLYLALNCLQGRPMQDAFEELAALDPDGVQLTPGNAPTEGFRDFVQESGVAVRTHHGFVDSALRQRVWSDAGALTGTWDSVHPPHRGAADWTPASADMICLETMYPGQPLGTGEALERAMETRLRLAVDVSHIYIQKRQGVISDAQWRALQDYDRIEELHVSANDGRRDSHRPLAKESFGLDWVRDRARDGTPVILECYMHKMSQTERRAQIAIARGHDG